jgi:hypothetical protein
MLSAEWLLEEVLEGEDGAGPEPADHLKATVIDTRIVPEVRKQADSVREVINHAAQRTGRTPANVTFDVQGLVEDLPDDWYPEKLADPAVVDSICDAEGLTNWWLALGQEPLEALTRNGLRDSLYRRRSLGKALYHAARDAGSDIVPETKPGEEVAVVAGLGGSTGSGMAFDFAADIEHGRVHLYAVLPSEVAKPDVKANAHAALSELEYGFLTGESPFTTVTLLPRPLNVDNAAFERAAVRSIIAHQTVAHRARDYQHRPLSANPNAPPAYAPFTVAVPQTVEFPIERRQRAEAHVEEFLTHKREELAVEADFLERTETYLKTSFPAVADVTLDEAAFPPTELTADVHPEEAVRLRHRLESDLRDTFLADETLDRTRYRDIADHIREIFDETFANCRERIDADDSDRHRQFLEHALDALLHHLDHDFAGEDVHTGEQELSDAVSTEVRNIAKRWNLTAATAAVTADRTDLSAADAELLREGLRSGLDPETRPLRLVHKLDDPVEMASDAADRLERRRDSLGKFHEEVALDVRERYEHWQHEVLADVELLTAINEYRDPVCSAIEDLVHAIADVLRELEAFAEDRVAPEDWFDVASVGPLDDFERTGVAPLNKRLEEMGVLTIDGERIQRAVDYATRAQRAYVEHDPSVFPFLGDDLSDEYAHWRHELERLDLVEVHPTELSPNEAPHEPFECTLLTEELRRESEIEASHRKTVDAIVTSFGDLFLKEAAPEFEWIVDDADWDDVDSVDDSGDSGPIRDDSLGPVAVTVPDRKRLAEIDDELVTALEHDVAETADDLFATVQQVVGDLTPDREGDRGTESGSADRTTLRAGSDGSTLAEAYLEPVRTAHGRIDDSFGRLVGEDGPPVGLGDRLERLRVLLVGEPRYSRFYSDLPTTPGDEDSPTGKRGVTALELSQRYEGLYAVGGEPEIEDWKDVRADPYRVWHDIDPDEPVAGAADVDEAGVLQSDRAADRIRLGFRESIDALFGNDWDHASVIDVDAIPMRHQPGNPDGEYTGPWFTNVYLSRTFDNGVGPGDSHIHEAVAAELQQHSIPAANCHPPERYSIGHPNEVTMVTLVSGLVLDSLLPITEPDGYLDSYKQLAGGDDPNQEGDDRRDHSWRTIASHTIGLGGAWDRWSTLGEWVEVAADRDVDLNSDSAFGGYVYRDAVRAVNADLFDDIATVADGNEGDPVDLFTDLLSVGTIENTVERD